VVDGAVYCEPVSEENSLIYSENTGNFIDFGPDLRSARSETAAAADAFFRNSRKFGTGELILKSREISGDIRELNEADQGIGAQGRRIGGTGERAALDESAPHRVEASRSRWIRF
jgi:hypothetical protein